MHIITTAVVLVLGSATLLLHDSRFIQWKPTMLLALAAAAFFGSMFSASSPSPGACWNRCSMSRWKFPAHLVADQFPVGGLASPCWR
jgi:hypothetical protein